MKKSHSKLSKKEPVCMFNEGCCVRGGGLSVWGWGKLSVIPFHLRLKTLRMV